MGTNGLDLQDFGKIKEIKLSENEQKQIKATGEYFDYLYDLKNDLRTQGKVMYFDVITSLKTGQSMHSYIYKEMNWYEKAI